MEFNHSYEIVFAVDTEVEDPANVPREILISALLERIANIIESCEATDCFNPTI